MPTTCNTDITFKVAVSEQKYLAEGIKKLFVEAVIVIELDMVHFYKLYYYLQRVFEENAINCLFPVRNYQHPH